MTPMELVAVFSYDNTIIQISYIYFNRPTHKDTYYCMCLPNYYYVRIIIAICLLLPVLPT